MFTCVVRVRPFQAPDLRAASQMLEEAQYHSGTSELSIPICFISILNTFEAQREVRQGEPERKIGRSFSNM